MKSKDNSKDTKVARRPKVLVSDIEIQRRNVAKKICEEKGWGAWIYENPTRSQLRGDTGEPID